MLQAAQRQARVLGSKRQVRNVLHWILLLRRRCDGRSSYRRLSRKLCSQRDGAVELSVPGRERLEQLAIEIGPEQPSFLPASMNPKDESTAATPSIQPDEAYSNLARSAAMSKRGALNAP